MASKDIREINRREDVAEWSSDEDFQGSRGSEGDWPSDNDWNEDSSSAGEGSVMSEGSEEEPPEEVKEKGQRNVKPKKDQSAKPTKLDLDDVGTEDDGESRQPEDITERTDGRYSKTNASDISDISDIEDQIAEAQNKLSDDKQSLSGVMGLVDEVTMKGIVTGNKFLIQHGAMCQELTNLKSTTRKGLDHTTGEKLTRKASETSLVVARGTFKKGVFSNDQLSLFDDDDISFTSYTEPNIVDDDHIPQRDTGKISSGCIEYMNYGEREEPNVPKQTLGLGHIEYLDETKSTDSGSLVSEQVDSSISKNVDDTVKGTKEDGKSETNENLNMTESEELPSEGKSRHRSASRTSLNSSKSNDTFMSRISNQLEAEETETEHMNDYEEEGAKEEVDEPVPSEQDDEIQRPICDSPEFKEFEDPECSKFGERHLCCFINLGGGGDDGRENELVNRLKKLKDDIANMRKELSLARQECKKESEEVAKLIEEATARNRAAEQTEIALPNSSSNMLPTYSSPTYALEEIMPTSILAQATILPGRTQAAIPTALLEDRLRSTRQTASSTYRASLNELERMVEKEMASIKDSMIRLEPLNRIAAEWDAVLPVRDPKRTTYKSDYRLEMVTSEMRLEAPGVKTAAIQDIKQQT